jgi:hypothetical protein
MVTELNAAIASSSGVEADAERSYCSLTVGSCLADVFCTVVLGDVEFFAFRRRADRRFAMVISPMLSATKERRKRGTGRGAPGGGGMEVERRFRLCWCVHINNRSAAGQLIHSGQARRQFVHAWPERSEQPWHGHLEAQPILSPSPSVFNTCVKQITYFICEPSIYASRQSHQTFCNM